MANLPFTIPDLYADFAEAQGLVRLEGDTLVLEYQTKDSIRGLIKSDVKIIRLPLNKLSSIKYEKKWFKGYLHISAKSMITLEHVPGNEHGALRLVISRKYKTAAEQLSIDAQLRIAELNLKDLDPDI